MALVLKIFWIAVGATDEKDNYYDTSREGHKNLYREKSGAIVNTDKVGYAQYMRAKNKKLSERREIEDLRSEIDELKNQLRQLLDR